MANPYLADHGEEVDLPRLEVRSPKIVAPEPEKEPVEILVEVDEPVDYQRPFIFESRKKNYWMVLASSAMVALLLAIVIQIYKPKSAKVTTAPPVETPVQTQPEVMAKLPVQQPKPEFKEPKVEPTQIGFSSENNELLIQSNGSRHFPVRVVVVGLPGQLQEGRVWFKSISTRPENGQMRLSLSDLELVRGYYRIRISTENGLKIEKDLAFGVEDDEFQKLRNKNRKDQSYWYNLDRIRLINRVARLRDTVNRYARQQETNLAYLREKDAVPEKIFYFEWEKYIELKGKVQRLSQKSRSLVQKDIETIRYDVENLYQRLGQLSVWR